MIDRRPFVHDLAEDTAATAAQLRLTQAFLRLVREARKSAPDEQAGVEFGNALFDCPEGVDVVAKLLPRFCSGDELRDILEAVDAMQSTLRPH